MEQWKNFLGDLNEKTATKAKAHFAKELTVYADEEAKKSVSPPTAKPLRGILKKPKEKKATVTTSPLVLRRPRKIQLPKANKPLKLKRSLDFERKVLRATNVQDKVEKALKAKRAKRKAIRKDMRNAINRRITNPVNDETESRYMEIATKGVVKFLQSVAALQN